MILAKPKAGLKSDDDVRREQSEPWRKSMKACSQGRSGRCFLRDSHESNILLLLY
jgi:hypothetical protein